MKKTNTRFAKFGWITFLALILVGYPIWKIVQLDPEGGCKELRYFSLCANAWIQQLDSHYQWEFRKLPSDREMIEKFNNNRKSFNTLAELSTKTGCSHLDQEIALDLSSCNRFDFYPKSKNIKGNSIPWAYSYRYAYTRYIKEIPSNDLTLYNRWKGYVYYITPPQINDMNHHKVISSGILTNKLAILANLDGPPWPNDWKEKSCWLRQIDHQWFIALCRDQVGG